MQDENTGDGNFRKGVRDWRWLAAPVSLACIYTLTEFHRQLDVPAFLVLVIGAFWGLGIFSEQEQRRYPGANLQQAIRAHVTALRRHPASWPLVGICCALLVAGGAAAAAAAAPTPWSAGLTDGIRFASMAFGASFLLRCMPWQMATILGAWALSDIAVSVVVQRFPETVVIGWFAAFLGAAAWGVAVFALLQRGERRIAR